jgi:hypothetical protein
MGWSNVGNITGAPGYSAIWLSGAGAPGGGTGNDGDMYLNLTTDDVYGPKAGGAWGGIVTNIKGANGAPGAPGTRGSLWYNGAGAPGVIPGVLAGDMYFNTTNNDIYAYS